jgi:uncharacterized protein YndB with AHSA1/START domain
MEAEMSDLVATAEIDITVPPERVWAALTDPAQIAQYMFGSMVETDWQPGSTIVWKGEYEGKPYEDKGEVITVQPPELLVLTHFSPMSGLEDVPANYHTLTYRLQRIANGTHLSLGQDHNADADEAAHSRDTWAAMLTQLKDAVEHA